MNTTELKRRCAIASVLLIALMLGVFAAVCTRTCAASQQLRESDARRRGTIYDRTGAAVAWSDGSSLSQRRYMHGEAYSSLVGYASAKHGSDGLERVYDDWLSAGSDCGGGDLHLTVDSGLQQLCGEQIAGWPVGAAVILDASTGAALAMTDSPSFEPSALDESYDEIVSRGCVFYNIAASPNMTVGEAFRPMCAAAMHDAGLADGASLIARGGSPGECRSEILAKAADIERVMRERMLLGQAVELDIGSVRSHCAMDVDECLDTLSGFDGLRVSPVQLCMLLAAVIRADGRMPIPYAVSRTVGADGEERHTEPRTVEGISPEAAALAMSMYTPREDGEPWVCRVTSVKSAAGGTIWLTASVPYGDTKLAVVLVAQDDAGSLTEADVASAAGRIAARLTGQHRPAA